MITYDFSNANNWSLLWSGNFTAQDVPNAVLDRFYPIPDITIPVLIENPILAIHAHSNRAEANWKYAGTAYQRIFTGLTVGGSPDSYIDSQKFYLDQITILRFQQLNSNYSVILRIPYWIREINLNLWQYTGQIIDSQEQKIDQILEQLQP